MFEKLLFARTIKFLDKFNILSRHQFGFRSKFATEYAITDIYEKLVHNLDSGLNSCAIFIDLAKAFDSVSHTILLQKLEYYGIRGDVLELFKSYLNDRSQFVKLNNTQSSLTKILFGVPQGSILGPLLFLKDNRGKLISPTPPKSLCSLKRGAAGNTYCRRCNSP